MKIEILGSGCAKCNKVKEIVEKVVNEDGIDAEIDRRARDEQDCSTPRSSRLGMYRWSGSMQYVQR